MTRYDWLQFIAQLSSFDLEVDSTKITLNRADSSSDLRIQLDWLIHVGGTVRKSLEDQIRSRAFSSSEIHFEMQMKPDPVLSFEVDAWLRTFMQPGRKIFVVPDALRESWIANVPRLRSFEWRAPEEEPLKLENELASFDISTAISAQEIDLFLADMRGADVDRHEPPWIFWSRLPGWLSHRKLREGRREDLFPIECRLAFLRCVLSPQDESSEAASLAAQALMVNPTFEIAERPLALENAREAPIVAFSRQLDAVYHRTLTSLEAVILDHTRESFRADLPKLVREISHETGVRKEFVEASIESLEINGFLLGKIDDGNAAPAH